MHPAGGEVLAPPVNEEPNERREEQDREPEAPVQRVDGAAEAGGDDGLAAGDEKHAIERERGRSEGAAHGAVPWPVEQIVRGPVTGDATLEERARVEDD